MTKQKDSSFLNPLSLLFIGALLLLLVCSCAAKTIKYSNRIEKKEAVAKQVFLNLRSQPTVIIIGDKEQLSKSAVKEIAQNVEATCKKNQKGGLKTLIINYMAVLDKAELAYECIINE